MDSEYQLFTILPSEIRELIIKLRVLTIRRKRKLLAEKFNSSEKYFIVYNIPLKVCKLSLN